MNTLLYKTDEKRRFFYRRSSSKSAKGGLKDSKNQRFLESFNSAANLAAEGRIGGLASFFIVGAGTQSVPGGLLAHRPQRRKFAPF